MAQTTQTQAPAATSAAGGGLHVRSKDGTLISYEKTGSGPVLIFVHGALGMKGVSFMANMAKEISKYFTVVSFDRRGRGESTDTKPYAVQREVEDIAALSKEFGGAPYVFGVSSGAALALEAAAAGVPMKGLVAQEPPYVAESPANTIPADYQAHVTSLIAEGRRDEAVKYFMRSVGVPGIMLGVMRVMPFWKSLRATAHTLPYDAAVMGDFHVPKKRFATIRVPTLIAFGTKTPPALQDAAKAAAKAIPNATIQAMPKQNHGVKPAVMAPVLKEYFTGPAGGGGR